MAKYKVTLMVEGKRLDSVEATARSAFAEHLISVQKVDPARSRQERLDEIANVVKDCAEDVDALKEELQVWYDGLPDNLQTGGKADELQDAITALEELKESIEGIDFTSVSFPGMY